MMKHSTLIVAVGAAAMALVGVQAQQGAPTSTLSAGDYIEFNSWPTGTRMPWIPALTTAQCMPTSLHPTDLSEMRRDMMLSPSWLGNTCRNKVRRT